MFFVVPIESVNKTNEIYNKNRKYFIEFNQKLCLLNSFCKSLIVKQHCKRILHRFRNSFSCVQAKVASPA